MKFAELNPGDHFEVWGDVSINYSYPKICRCEKVDDQTAREIERMEGDNVVQYGISFLMGGEDNIMPIETTVKS